MALSVISVPGLLYVLSCGDAQWLNVLFTAPACVTLCGSYCAVACTALMLPPLMVNDSTPSSPPSDTKVLQDQEGQEGEEGAQDKPPAPSGVHDTETVMKAMAALPMRGRRRAGAAALPMQRVAIPESSRDDDGDGGDDDDDDDDDGSSSSKHSDEGNDADAAAAAAGGDGCNGTGVATTAAADSPASVPMPPPPAPSADTTTSVSVSIPPPPLPHPPPPPPPPPSHHQSPPLEQEAPRGGRQRPPRCARCKHWCRVNVNRTALLPLLVILAACSLIITFAGSCVALRRYVVRRVLCTCTL